MMNIIISLKGLQKVMDYTLDVCTFNKFYFLPEWQVQQVPDKQQEPDKWRDACKLHKFVKFGAVSYNN